jgi:hypothetical protein
MTHSVKSKMERVWKVMEQMQDGSLSGNCHHYLERALSDLELSLPPAKTVMTYHDSEGCPGLDVNIVTFGASAVYFQGDGHILMAIVAGPEEDRQGLAEKVNEFLKQKGRYTLEGPDAAKEFRAYVET